MGRLRMPAEFATHDGTVIAWPCRDEIYPGALMDEARDAHAELARTISRYEPVWMIAAPRDAELAAERCGSTVDVVELPIDDSWFRDSGPIYVFDGTERIALDFTFNGWGEKFAPWDQDDAIAAKWAAYAGHPSRKVPMVFEGGSITVDGAGTGATTTQCLMHPNRNPGLTHTEIEDQVCDALGLDAVVWLPYGLALDDDTDGHVDNVACFTEPGTLLVQGCDDPTEDDLWILPTLAAAYAEPEVDRLADAKRIADLILTLDPDFSVAEQVALLPYKVPEQARRAAAAMRRAGLPD